MAWRPPCGQVRKATRIASSCWSLRGPTSSRKVMYVNSRFFCVDESGWVGGESWSEGDSSGKWWQLVRRFRDFFCFALFLFYCSCYASVFLALFVPIVSLHTYSSFFVFFCKALTVSDFFSLRIRICRYIFWFVDIFSDSSIYFLLSLSFAASA